MYLCVPTRTGCSGRILTTIAYVDFVFVCATDDVFLGDGQGVDTPPSLALQHVGALQVSQVPHLQDMLKGQHPLSAITATGIVYSYKVW